MMDITAMVSVFVLDLPRLVYQWSVRMHSCACLFCCINSKIVIDPSKKTTPFDGHGGVSGGGGSLEHICNSLLRQRFEYALLRWNFYTFSDESFGMTYCFRGTYCSVAITYYVIWALSNFLVTLNVVCMF